MSRTNTTNYKTISLKDDLSRTLAIELEDGFPDNEAVKLFCDGTAVDRLAERLIDVFEDHLNEQAKELVDEMKGRVLR